MKITHLSHFKYKFSKYHYIQMHNNKGKLIDNKSPRFYIEVKNKQTNKNLRNPYLNRCRLPVYLS